MTISKSAGNHRLIVFLLSLAIILGAILRIVGLDRGLWWDEIYFLVVSVRKPLTEIVTTFPGDNQHPLYSVLARLSVMTFGEHVWTIRLPALIFGVATIPALYWLASRVASRWEALLAAAFLAVSYHHVWFSQNARGYTALAFWAVLATGLFLRAIQTGRRGYWVGYAFAAALGMYTHLTMIFLLVSQALIVFGLALADRRAGVERSHWRSAILGFGLAGVFTLLLYAPIVGQVQNFFLHRPSTMRGVSTPSWALREMFRVLSIGLGTWVALVGAAALALAGAFSYLRQDKLVLALFLLPVAVTAGGAFLARGTMYPRFYFFLIGFGVIVLIRGIFVIPAWIAPRAQRPLTAVLAVALLAGSAYSLMRNYRYPKQDFEDAIAFLGHERQPGDTLLTAGASTYPLSKYYGMTWDDVRSTEQLTQICGQGGRVWIVYTFPRYLEAALPGVMDMIRKSFITVRVFPGTVGDGDVFVARYAGK
jgi:uncharacterized membrane protein